MSEKPYEDIDLEVDEEKFHALVAEDEKAYQDFKDSPMGKLLLSNLDGDWNALPSERTTGDLLRLAVPKLPRDPDAMPIDGADLGMEPLCDVEEVEGP